ncbi:hypothetical protein V6N12_043519 [Hibiscus sabdariffa]|uniref:Uncharacterized protein n=1 Tax=Hibiscus sabdariffa TaxID=183260 RepID=A0ABR2DFK1_9ROSI
MILSLSLSYNEKNVDVKTTCNCEELSKKLSTGSPVLKLDSEIDELSIHTNATIYMHCTYYIQVFASLTETSKVNCVQEFNLQSDIQYDRIELDLVKNILIVIFGINFA